LQGRGDEQRQSQALRRPVRQLTPGQQTRVSDPIQMIDAGGLRERVEDSALLWSLVLVVAVLSVLPLARLLLEGIAPAGHLSADALLRGLGTSSTWTATQHSLVTAFGGTLLAVVVGTLVALTVSLTDIRGANAFVFCFVAPLLLAAQVVALAWLQVFGPSSTLLKHFGIPALLGIPGNYLVLPTLIYQRLAGLVPGVLSELAVLSVLIGAIAVIGIVSQDLLLRGRDFRTVSASAVARPFELQRWRLPVEVALWTLTALLLVLPLTALVLTSLVPAVGVPLNFESATADNYHFVLLEHAGTRRVLRNSFGLSATAAIAIVVI